MLESDKILPSGLRRRTSVSSDGILQVETSDPYADAILEHNLKLRNEGAVTKGVDIHHALDIPEFAYAMLCRKYPDLDCGDGEIEGRAWKKFIASTESIPYRVTG